MKQGKCETAACTADAIGKCHVGNDSPEECPNWRPISKVIIQEKSVTRQKFEVPWSGEDFKLTDIEKISRRSSPNIIGIAGHEDSGKTSFLGALFTLLANGHALKEHTFSGSETLLRWEYLIRKLRFDTGKVSFPPPTPSGGDYFSFLHLMLKSSSGKAKDILFADLSGEVFSQWTVDVNSSNVGNVRWLTNFSNGFIFFVNAKTIAERRMAGVNDILDMAHRLKDSIDGKPVVGVWSKADEISKVKEQHTEIIERELKSLFNQKEIPQISNFLDVQANPDSKSLNNLHLLDELLSRFAVEQMPRILIENKVQTSDLFLNYYSYGKL